jgi:LuxR family transcriptional regulator, maltose regulon positive regulatory protein
MISERTPSDFLSMPLLATRFFLPPRPAGWISRPRLTALLDGGLERRLILVSAPPGFGKSTVCGEWIRSHTALNAAWVSLESSDQDWGLFFRYLVTAWQQVFPQAGQAALAELTVSTLPRQEALNNLLLNDLLSASQKDGAQGSVLVLDDYHQVNSSAVHETVAYLVEHLPPGCHLVLLTRADPPLPLARWRSFGWMLEVRADDLRFTPTEAADYLNQGMQLGLSPYLVQTLEMRTEGWIVGLKLAAISLQGNLDPGSFVRRFGGTQRFVLDYLVEEVLKQQPRLNQEFLMSTALLDRFCGPLCDTVVDRPAGFSQDLLEGFEKANLFLIPLDDERRWFRYHRLFGDLLKARLEQTDPGRMSEIYARAAAWCSQNSLWREAIQYALKTRDFECSAGIFEQSIRSGGRAFLYSGVGPLIAPFPDELIQTRPLLSLAKAISRIESAQLAGIEPLLRFAGQGVESAPHFDGQEQLLGWIYVIQSRAAAILGDGEWITQASRQVVRLIPGDAEAHTHALLHLGLVDYYAGDLNRTDACWQEALDVSQAAGYLYGRLCLSDNLGRICSHKGELDRAEALFQTGLQISKEIHDSYPRWQGAIERDYSDVLREQNRLDEALARITTGLALCEQWDLASGLGMGYLHHGRILLSLGDPPGADAAIKKAEEIYRGHTVYPDMEVLVQLFKAQLSLAAGDLDQAWKVLEACRQAPSCQHDLPQEWVRIAQARVLVWMKRPEEALALLAGAGEKSKAAGRGRNWLEITLLTSLALDLTGHQEGAFRALRDGLEYTRARGFKRIFVDEGRRMQELIERFRVVNPLDPGVEWVLELLSLYPSTGIITARGSMTNSPLVEPLTQREQEILGLLCQGLSNREIARRTFLSLGTVKTHVHNLFSKLGVRDRPQAIAKAHELGLVKREGGI